MSKKLMVLALAVVSASILALPTVASASVPWNIDPAGVGFSGTTGLGKLLAANEPTITCEGPNHVTGSYDNGSQTTGSISLDFTACHIVVIGFTIKCHTAGAPLENTIQSGGTFHNVKITGGKPGILVTPNTTTVTCGSTTPIIVEGTVIGQITAPACNVETTTSTLKFGVTNGVQNHTTVDGTTTEYDLTAETEGSGVKRTAAEEAEGTIEYTAPAKLTC